MFRNIGVVALLLCLCLVAGSAFATNQTPAAASPTLTDTDPAKEDGKPEATQMKERPYAEYLHRKVKKDKGPSGPEPKYKPWDKVVTKDHQKQEGLLTFYTKQEELLLAIPKDKLDKPGVSLLMAFDMLSSLVIFGATLLAWVAATDGAPIGQFRYLLSSA